MHMTRLLAIAALMLTLSTACTETPEVPVPAPGTVDATPPLLRLGSAGLRKDILITQDTTAAENRRARSTDDLLFLATATDRETGIRRVSIRGELIIICIPANSTHEVRIRDPVAEDRVIPAEATRLPVELAKQYGLNVPVRRQQCPSSRFHELKLELRAEAENGVGQVRALVPAIISSFGPDTVRVGTFNLFRPGNHPDSVYERWGQTLGSLADVLLLTEVEDRRRAELLASAAGMPHVVVFAETNSDLAILSRAPLRNVTRKIIIPPNSLDSANSTILSAETDLGFYPHQVVATHWGIRDANNAVALPWMSSTFRFMAAQTILNLLSPPPAIAIVGGDLNSYSSIGPQLQPGGTTEVTLLRGQLTDTFSALELPNDQHCSDQRIDYVMFRGPYVPISYQACFQEANPSDHPFVLATLAAE